MRIKKNSELYNMDEISNTRLRFLYNAFEKPTTAKQRFIKSRINHEISKRCKYASDFEI
mgnify:CR=1 FL=1